MANMKGNIKEMNQKYLKENDLNQMVIEKYAMYLENDTNIDFTLEKINDELMDCPYTDADDFRQGSCQLFAYALNEKYGYPVYIIEKGPYFHIFCKTKDGLNYVDVRGMTSSFCEFILELDVS